MKLSLYMPLAVETWMIIQIIQLMSIEEEHNPGPINKLFFKGHSVVLLLFLSNLPG